MIGKNEIKHIKSLSQKKFRDELALFAVEGEKLVQEALASDFEVENVYRIEDIGEQAMSRITMLSSPSPVLAVVRKKLFDSSSVEAEGLILALDSVRDPGNLGTIIRIADWFGIRTILASRDTVDVYNPKVVQATMGAIFRVKLIYCDLPDTLEILSKSMPVYGTFLEGENIYTETLDKNAVIVMGSESNGISDKVASIVSRKIHIPSFTQGEATSESLNVAVASAITCSEFRRRQV